MDRRERNRSDFKTERQFQRREGNFNDAISGDGSPRQSLFPQFRRKATICRETPFIETITIYEKPAISEWDVIFNSQRQFRDDRNFQEPRHFRGKSKDLTMKFHFARFKLRFPRNSQFENGREICQEATFLLMKSRFRRNSQFRNVMRI